MKIKTQMFRDQKGIAIAFITFFIAVVAVSVTWIAMNELVLHVGDYATNFPPARYGITLTILFTLWRATPVALLFCLVAYVLLKAHKSSRYGG